MYRKWFILIAILMLGVIPALAQSASTSSVSFNGVSFNFDPALATNVSITQYPGDSPELGAGGADAPHIQFILDSQYPVRESIFDAGGVRVYNTADFVTYEWLTTQLQQLQTLLTDRPDLAQYMAPAENANVNALPFVPVLAAGQVIRARAQYIETAALRGISYVTAYKQDVSPLLTGDFIYTFQGVSTDGTRYFSAIFKLNASAFPAEDSADFNMETFQAQLQTYFTASIATLNAGAPTDFTPSLASLDALVQSITFASVSGGTGGEVVPTPTTSSDPTLRGLADKTWTLVSYGSADAPVTVLPEAPVMAIFAESGISGNASCNSYSGPFQYDNEALTFGELISTRMACSEPIMAQETAYLAALSSATSYTITDLQLQIVYDGGVLTFTSLGRLGGKTWTLVSYGSVDAPVAVLPDAPVTAVFAESGISGNASCNSYSGPFQYDTETLTFGQLISTLMACSEPIMAQETAYLAALTTATSYTISDNQLQIFYDGGVLTFTAAA